MPILKFSDHESTTHRAIVVSLDLAGFSNFCNHPEPSVAIVVPQLIKRVFDSLNEMLSERDEAEVYGLSEPDDCGKPPRPKLNKYTGDGSLMLWLRPSEEQFPQEFCNLIIETMRNFQNKLSGQLPVWEKEWRVQKVPKRVRVGIATGIVYGMRPPHLYLANIRFTDPCDYVGYCINLAVRLQSHCPDLGFLVHQNLYPELEGMKCFTAKKLKGIQDEPVALFAEDVLRVSAAEFSRKFERL